MSSAMDLTGNPTKCYIAELPLEVLLRITRLLPTPDLGNLRLTCQNIDRFLFNAFAKEFFSCKQFMLTEFSIEALVGISKSRLSSSVRRLQIGLDQFMAPNRIYQGSITTMAYENNLPADIQFIPEKVAELFGRQARFRASGMALEMLAEAIQNLENLEDVVVRDCNSKTRYRDFPNIQWRSYGSTSAFMKWGALSSMVSNVPATHLNKTYEETFAIVLGALGKANARPRGIETIFRRSAHLSEYAFTIPPYWKTTVVPVLENLAKLHITISIDTYDHDGQRYPKSTQIKGFLSHTKNLKDLRINGATGRQNHAVDTVLQALGEPDSSESAGGEPELLPRLKELSLGLVETEPEPLIATVKKFAPTLESLSLWKVTLRRSPNLRIPQQYDNSSDDDENMVDYDEDDHRRIDRLPACRFLLKELLKIPNLNPRSLKMGHFREVIDDIGVSAHHVVFKNKPEVKYIGIDWRHFLGEAIPKLRVKSNRTHAVDDFDLGTFVNDQEEVTGDVIGGIIGAQAQLQLAHLNNQGDNVNAFVPADIGNNDDD